MRNAPLPRDFYARGALDLAPALLGKLLCHAAPEGFAAGVIVETEAYCGAADDGAHSFGARRTARTEIQYGEGGYAYVFSIYGMHCCFNAVCGAPGEPEVVLVRALEPVEGLPLMAERRGTQDVPLLCSGPGRLCRALGITRAQYGLDLCEGPLYIAEHAAIAPEHIAVSPRKRGSSYRCAGWWGSRCISPAAAPVWTPSGPGSRSWAKSPPSRATSQTISMRSPSPNRTPGSASTR